MVDLHKLSLHMRTYLTAKAQIKSKFKMGNFLKSLHNTGCP